MCSWCFTSGIWHVATVSSIPTKRFLSEISEWRNACSTRTTTSSIKRVGRLIYNLKVLYKSLVMWVLKHVEFCAIYLSVWSICSCYCFCTVLALHGLICGFSFIHSKDLYSAPSISLLRGAQLRCYISGFALCVCVCVCRWVRVKQWRHRRWNRRRDNDPRNRSCSRLLPPTTKRKETKERSASSASSPSSLSIIIKTYRPNHLHCHSHYCDCADPNYPHHHPRHYYLYQAHS